MDWPKLLVFVRHAESEGNVITSSDERASLDRSHHVLALTDRGRKQAIITGDYLRKRFGDFDAHFTSYYERTKETLQLMFPQAKGIEDARLAERQGGIWQAMTESQVMNRYPEEFERKKREGYYHYRPFGGENWPDIELRIHSFLDMLRRDYSGKNILCVTHGNWLILFQKIMHNSSIEKALDDFEKGVFENASVTFYEKGELRELNVAPWKEQVD